MRRRQFIALFGGAAALRPVLARAQQPERMRRIGAILPGNENDPEMLGRKAAFMEGLQKYGWVEGINIAIDVRWIGNDTGRVLTYATELIGTSDVIWAVGGLTLLVMKRATRAVPIVFTQVYDPVGSGFVTNINRPEGNITGFTIGEISMGGKLLELLKEIAPQVTRATVLLNLEHPPQVAMWHSIEATAPMLGLKVTPADAPSFEDTQRAIESSSHEPNGGLVVFGGPVATLNRSLIVSLITKYRIPAVYTLRFYVESGGMASYGVNLNNQAREAASYFSRILKGEKIVNLPIQQPTSFELVVNLKAAKEVGIKIPESVLSRADEVIE